jgi:hypothetical protein
MFVNGVPFLFSVSQGINLVTAKHMPSCTAKQLAAVIRGIMDLYSCGGFQVGPLLLDNKFEKLRVLIPILVVNTTAAKEHVPELERRICLIKEHGRGILNTVGTLPNGYICTYLLSQVPTRQSVPTSRNCLPS